MDSRVFSIIMAAALATWVCRFLPFMVFRNKDIPSWLHKLGKILPPAIMMLLIVYCFRDVNFMGGSHGLSEIIASLVTIVLYKKTHNILISIVVSTIIYMICVQFIFIV